MILQFFDQPTKKAGTRGWAAKPAPTHTFTIVEISAQDLKNRLEGKVNFLGWEKPKFGTLEELTMVYIATWVRVAETVHVTPLAGNHYGGFKTHREAVQMCSDVWRMRHRWLPPVILRGA